ncbi:uncharacterized protein Triagg1_10887 [Trichoderma aggressivum f. europaeum]|uniref:Uncharacterized protein n=1 Tax=Trichoderma aggressivum f. europaeum TaxID=173218 RepID=A0AAE1I8B1_9HYPO|nr:hypothetical protein Triagg1_10887 [Trichoderma aggressivum f. europaeum]
MSSQPPNPLGSQDQSSGGDSPETPSSMDVSDGHVSPEPRNLEALYNQLATIITDSRPSECTDPVEQRAILTDLVDFRSKTHAQLQQVRGRASLLVLKWKEAHWNALQFQDQVHRNTLHHPTFQRYMRDVLWSLGINLEQRSMIDTLGIVLTNPHNASVDKINSTRLLIIREMGDVPRATAERVAERVADILTFCRNWAMSLRLQPTFGLDAGTLYSDVFVLNGLMRVDGRYHTNPPIDQVSNFNPTWLNKPPIWGTINTVISITDEICNRFSES